MSARDTLAFAMDSRVKPANDELEVLAIDEANPRPV
jgi:hypothetical protein